jgi:two-component system chemotaxis response regulator CheY
MNGEFSASTREEMMQGKDKVALIIDDSRVNQNILMNLLEERGFQTYSAYDGAKGIEEFRTINPTLTFLDIVMPKMSGLEVLKGIRAINPRAKVIMVTSLVSKKVIQQVKNAKADWFIRKPFNEQQITEILNRFDPR